MAQQPNVEITDAERPRRSLESGSAVRWRAGKPGIPTGPDEVPSGGGFGHAGPDAGWALRLVRDAELPDDDRRLRRLVTGLVLARAAASGRAPVPEDIEAALVLCGYYPDAPAYLVDRRQRWLHAVPHESRPGSTAASEVDRELIVAKPDEIRYVLAKRR